MAQRLVTAEEMRRIDAQATRKLSIPSIVLMENAARSVCEGWGSALASPICGSATSGMTNRPWTEYFCSYSRVVLIGLAERAAIRVGCPSVGRRLSGW